MPLNLQNDFIAHIRWMAQTATWRKSDPDGHVPVTWEHAVFDLANVQTGWGIFAEGQAPEWVMDPTLSKKAAKPQDAREWRRGFKVLVFSDSALDGLREFATTAVGANRGIGELYSQFEAATAQHPGKVPVVHYTGSTPLRVGKGNTSIPNFSIVYWVDRPEGLRVQEVPPERPAYALDPQAPLPGTGDPNDKIPYDL